MIEPLQAVTAQLPSTFKSAMLVGDVVRIDEHILQCLLLDKTYITMLVFILIFMLT